MGNSSGVAQSRAVAGGDARGPRAPPDTQIIFSGDEQSLVPEVEERERRQPQQRDEPVSRRHTCRRWPQHRLQYQRRQHRRLRQRTTPERNFQQEPQKAPPDIRGIHEPPIKIRPVSCNRPRPHQVWATRDTTRWRKRRCETATTATAGNRKGGEEVGSLTSSHEQASVSSRPGRTSGCLDALGSAWVDGCRRPDKRRLHRQF